MTSLNNDRFNNVEMALMSLPLCDNKLQRLHDYICNYAYTSNYMHVTIMFSNALL